MSVYRIPQVDLATEKFEVAIEGPVYCSPCEPGCVAPAGFRGEFRAHGTIEEIGRAWRVWCATPTRSARGYDYPRRFILGQTPLDQIVNELILRHGGSWGHYCGAVSRLLRGFAGSYEVIE